MIIRTSSTTYKLYRYGGSAGGKNLEIKLGTLPFGTKPDAIPLELLEDLTPKEQRLLREKLVEDQQAVVVGKVSKVVADIQEMVMAIDSGWLATDAMEALHKANADLAAQFRTTRKR